MTGSQFPRAASGQTIVIDGDLWNRLMDQVERNGRFYAAPPLLLQDNAGGKVLTLARTPPDTDYTVYISAGGTGTDLGAHTGGIYDGYCFRTLPASGPTAGTFCRIINDDEYQSGNSGTGTGDSHWVTGNSGIGRFDGEYTSEATPRMIIHAGGFSPTLDDGAPIVPFRATQAWQRDAPYVDPTNVANNLIGDVAPTITVMTSATTGRTLRFDASGRLWSISHE